MIYELYEKHLKKNLTVFPKELCLMITGKELAEDREKLLAVLRWVQEFPEIKRFIIHISAKSADEAVFPAEEFAKTCTVRVSSPAKDISLGCGTPEVLAVFGKCGRREIADAVAKIAEAGISTEDITEKTIEEHLLYQVTPDFVIKTGGNHLTDFLIWQSVYSELFFADVNWNRFRRVDFLRALRDYQSRQRRFGK